MTTEDRHVHSAEFADYLRITRPSFKWLVWQAKHREERNVPGDVGLPPPDGYEWYDVTIRTGRVMRVQGPYWLASKAEAYARQGRKRPRSTNLYRLEERERQARERVSA